MDSIRSFILRVPILNRASLFLRRYLIARSFHASNASLVRRWLFSSRETTNFTYDLEPLNRLHLVAFLIQVTGRSAGELLGYFDELENDQALQSHVRQLTEQHPEYRLRADRRARFGRRLGWYALVRALKPRIVVETGVDKGLGAVVLASALQRNEGEGSPGRYFGTDIEPAAGYLFKQPYSDYGDILRGDSCESLSKLKETIDLFICDSNHTPDYERREYSVIQDRLDRMAVVLSDNAHTNDTLLHFAQQTGRAFLFFKESPRDHWYPGAGIGAAYVAPHIQTPTTSTLNSG